MHGVTTAISGLQVGGAGAESAVEQSLTHHAGPGPCPAVRVPVHRQQLQTRTT